MKSINKYFDSLKKAERYQNALYNKYAHVRLVSFPRYSEDGIYGWEVKND